MNDTASHLLPLRITGDRCVFRNQPVYALQRDILDMQLHLFHTCMNLSWHVQYSCRLHRIFAFEVAEMYVDRYLGVSFLKAQKRADEDQQVLSLAYRLWLWVLKVANDIVIREERSVFPLSSCSKAQAELLYSRPQARQDRHLNAIMSLPKRFTAYTHVPTCTSYMESFTPRTQRLLWTRYLIQPRNANSLTYIHVYVVSK